VKNRGKLGVDIVGHRKARDFANNNNRDDTSTLVIS
jgi:hypothetical protein